MEFLVGIIDILLTLLIFGNLYKKIFEVSKIDKCIFYFLLVVIQIVFGYLLSFITSEHWMMIANYFFNSLFPIIFYCYLTIYKKYPSPKSIFIGLVMSLLYHSTNTFFSIIVSSLTGDDFVRQNEQVFFLAINLITYIVTNNIINDFNLTVKYFDKEYLYSFLKKVLITLLVMHIIFFISDTVGTIAHFNNFGDILATIVFICMLLVFFMMNSHKVRIEKEIALEQKKFEQEHLQSYTDEIVSLYNEIRGFRHDYTGMLVSMRMAIESKNLHEIDRVYNEVLVKANQKLRSDKYTYFDLNNIEDSALRSLVAQSIVNAKTNNVEFTLEVKDIITPLSMELLDLVRVMSVLLNNAVEGAVESYHKRVEVAVIQLDFETLIVIQNSCKNRKLKSEDLFELGFSTKGKNRGFGLNNVREILAKYDNVILETEMDNGLFKQVIRFKRNQI